VLLVINSRSALSDSERASLTADDAVCLRFKVRRRAANALRWNLLLVDPARRPCCSNFFGLPIEESVTNAVGAGVPKAESFLTLLVSECCALANRILCAGRDQRFRVNNLENVGLVSKWLIFAAASFCPFALMVSSKFLFDLPEIFLIRAKLRLSELWWKRARRSLVIAERPRRRRFFSLRTRRCALRIGSLIWNPFLAQASFFAVTRGRLKTSLVTLLLKITRVLSRRRGTRSSRSCIVQKTALLCLN